MTKKYTKLVNVDVRDITDARGRRDPLAAWWLDMASTDRDVKAFYVDEKDLVLVDSQRLGFVKQSEYEQLSGLRFKVHGDREDALQDAQVKALIPAEKYYQPAPISWFKEEEFPLYQLLVKKNETGVELAKKDFAIALTGGMEEKVTFALGIQTVAINAVTGQPDVTVVPGNTEEINQKTLRSCRAVFQEAAEKGDAKAEIILASYKQRGIGL